MCSSTFDMMTEKNHHVVMDNVYNSVTFFKDIYFHTNKVKIYGVTQKELGGNT